MYVAIRDFIVEWLALKNPNPSVGVQISVEPEKLFFEIKNFFPLKWTRGGAKNTMFWPGRDLNTQPSELEPDALLFCH